MCDRLAGRARRLSARGRSADRSLWATPGRLDPLGVDLAASVAGCRCGSRSSRKSLPRASRPRHQIAPATTGDHRRPGPRRARHSRSTAWSSRRWAAARPSPVSDRCGQFTLRSLMPGPYLVRAHRDGYLPARSTIVNVRPSSRDTVDVHAAPRGAAAGDPRIAAAGVGGRRDGGAGRRSEAATSAVKPRWRLRHLKRSVLKDSDTATALPADDDWFLTDSFEFLGRAVESSARMAGALFTHSPLEGQVNLLTTGAFDSPGELLQLDRTRGVAYFSVGATVGEHGDWTVQGRAQSGRPQLVDPRRQLRHARAGARIGISSACRTACTATRAATPPRSPRWPRAARNVGTVYAYDDWTVSSASRSATAPLRALRLPDRTGAPQPAGERDASADRSARIRAVAAAAVSAPGAEEFLPPSRAQVAAAAAHVRAADAGRVPARGPAALRGRRRATARRRHDRRARLPPARSTISSSRVFGLRRPTGLPPTLGHYYVGSAGDVDVRRLGRLVTHALTPNVRGSVRLLVRRLPSGRTAARSIARALARIMPSALRNGSDERIHDFTTSLETEVPQTRDARLRALQDEQRLTSAPTAPRRARARRPLGRAGQPGAAVHELHERRVGNAGRRPQPVPRIVHRSLDLRRTARRPSAQAARRRHHRQVSELGLVGRAAIRRYAFVAPAAPPEATMLAHPAVGSPRRSKFGYCRRGLSRQACTQIYRYTMTLWLSISVPTWYAVCSADASEDVV